MIRHSHSTNNRSPQKFNCLVYPVTQDSCLATQTTYLMPTRGKNLKIEKQITNGKPVKEDAEAMQTANPTV